MTARKSSMHRPDCADGERSKDTWGNRPKMRQTLNWERVQISVVPGNSWPAASSPSTYVNTRKEGAVLSDKKRMHLGDAGFQPCRRLSILRLSEWVRERDSKETPFPFLETWYLPAFLLKYGRTWTTGPWGRERLGENVGRCEHCNKKV